MAYYSLHPSHDAATAARWRAGDEASLQDMCVELTEYPYFRYCLGVIANSTLANDLLVAIDGRPAAAGFSRFVNKHYKPFLRDCVEYMAVYGFVPFVVRRAACGNKLPVILPHGSFSWKVGPRKAAKGVRYNNDNTHILQYNVSLRENAQGVTGTIFVYQHTTPRPSGVGPLGHVVTDYRYFRDAMRRADELDKWNATPHLFTCYKPSPLAAAVDPERSLMDFVNPELASLLAPPNHDKRDEIIRTHVDDAETCRRPNLYTMPADHTLEQLPSLQTNTNVMNLRTTLHTSIAHCLNIPAFMLEAVPKSNTRFEASSARVQGSSSTTKTSCRTFFTHIKNVSAALEEIAAFAYAGAYPDSKENCMVRVEPEHWLHIESMDDIAALCAAGLLDPVAVQPFATSLLESTVSRVENVSLKAQKARFRARSGAHDKADGTADERADRGSTGVGI
jgi:hypothetical protein